MLRLPVLLMLFGLVHAAYAGPESRVSCADQLAPPVVEFLADPRFHWAEWPDLDRKPPDLFTSKLAALVMPYMERLPEGLSAEEKQFYSGVFKTLRDRARVFELLKLVEADLEQLPGEDRARAFEALLRTYEMQVKLKVTRLRTRMTRGQFFQVLAQGFTFIDEVPTDLALQLGPGLQAQAGHWRHTQLAHRLQTHLILRDLILRPAHYGSPNDVLSLYKRLGSEDLHRQLDWSATGVDFEAPRTRDAHTLYFQLFDSHENNGSSPGFYWEYREYWPTIPLR